MRHAGLVGFRRHDPDVVRQRARYFFAGVQARCVDAVVMCDEDAHYNALSFRDGAQRRARNPDATKKLANLVLDSGFAASRRPGMTNNFCPEPITSLSR